MTKEEQIVLLLEADTTLMDLLTGGIYSYQEVGIEGIRRGEDSPTADAFDENGELLPCAMVRESGMVPYGTIRNPSQGFMAQSQVVAIYFYEMRGHDVILPAAERVFTLLEDTRLTPSYPLWMANQTAPAPDTGPILNSTAIVQDWMVVSMRRPA